MTRWERKQVRESARELRRERFALALRIYRDSCIPDFTRKNPRLYLSDAGIARRVGIAPKTLMRWKKGAEWQKAAAVIDEESSRLWTAHLEQKQKYREARRGLERVHGMGRIARTLFPLR